MAIIYDFIGYKKNKENASPFRDWLHEARLEEDLLKGVKRPWWCGLKTTIQASCWINKISTCVILACPYTKWRRNQMKGATMENDLTNERLVDLLIGEALLLGGDGKKDKSNLKEARSLILARMTKPMGEPMGEEEALLKAYEETLPIQVRVVKSLYGEYKMNILRGPAETAYYTDELDDAFCTAIVDYGEDIEVVGPKYIKKAFLTYQKNRRDNNEKGL